MGERSQHLLLRLPSDRFMAMDGKTVEMDNTDTGGRLILGSIFSTSTSCHG